MHVRLTAPLTPRLPTLELLTVLDVLAALAVGVLVAGTGPVAVRVLLTVLVWLAGLAAAVVLTFTVVRVGGVSLGRGD